MMRKITFIFVVFTLFFWSCKNDIIIHESAEDLIVAEAYLYAGEPVDDIYLTSLLTYGGEDSVYQTVSDADVAIIHADVRFELTPSDSAGYYHYEGNGLQINVGETYSIEINYYDKTAYGTTIVPEPPTGITISDTAIYIDESEFQSNPPEYMQEIGEIEITWDEGDGDYFYVLVENIEEDPENIDDNMPDDFNPFRFVSRPVQFNSYILMPMMTIQQYGKHRVRVFRVNREYADLYESMQQDSRNLNEPLTNIENGLGVFTAFSCDSIFFNVIKE